MEAEIEKGASTTIQQEEKKDLGNGFGDRSPDE